MMTFNQIGSIHNAAAFGHTDTQFFANLAQGNVLTRVLLNGIINAQAVTATMTTGNFIQDGFQGGLQYGAHGYTVQPFTANGLNGASWLTYGDLLPHTVEDEYLLASLPFSYTNIFARPITIDWRGHFICNQSLDFYGVFGCDVTKLSNFGTGYEWYMEWAS